MLYVIGAPSKTLNKLRICTLHFTDDMICSYTQKRVLKDNAFPTINVPTYVSVIDQSKASTSTEPTHVVSAENISCESDLLQCPREEETVREEETTRAEEIIQEKENTEENVLQTRRATVRPATLSKEIRNLKKLLHKKKKHIKMQGARIRELRRDNKWDEIIKDAGNIQKVFFDMIKNNLYCAPQVCFLLKERILEKKVLHIYMDKFNV